MTSGTVLIVDDDDAILESAGDALRHSGFSVLAARDGASAYRLFSSEPLHAVVLDISIDRSYLSDGVIEDGLGLLRRLRQESDVPILMLSATTAESVKVLSLNLGADDYVTKPFSGFELAARIKAVLRRAGGEAPRPVERLGHLVVDLEEMSVTRDGQPVHLTLTEFRILEVLLRAHGRVLSRQQILDAARGPDYFGDERAVDVHIRHLRTKLEIDSQAPALLQTVRGVGYRLCPPETET